MRLVRWRPRTGQPVYHDYFNGMFGDLFEQDRNRMDLQNFDWAPRVNVEEQEDRFEITADVPGMKSARGATAPSRERSLFRRT
jgi:HSP20 family molecular chaperone IbpA